MAQTLHVFLNFEPISTTVIRTLCKAFYTNHRSKKLATTTVFCPLYKTQRMQVNVKLTRNTSSCYPIHAFTILRQID